jgi:hypothetical protein
MADISTKRISFLVGNPWGITDGTNDVAFSLTWLVHAAVTAGHGPGWRQAALPNIAGQWELLWKTSALRVAVCEQNTQPSWRSPRLRLVPTDRLNRMDPSERRALSYHLGITLSVAWARRALSIPWLLHLDVYQSAFNVNLQPGNSRPDLVGRHPNGSWAVFEAKGRGTPPDPKAEKKAKDQAKRVVDIGGVAPTSRFAFFSYYAPDKSAVGRKKPKVVHIRVVDPEPEEIEDPINLPLFTVDNFFRLYYEPWWTLLAETAKLAPSQDGRFIWRRLEDLDFRIGMLKDVAGALSRERYGELPEIIHRAEEQERLRDQYLDWAGDGLLIEPGDSWRNLLREDEEQQK